MSATGGNKQNSVFVNILWIGLLTGTLDAVAAIIISYPATFSQIFRYIASGWFGETAFIGNNMILWGVLFHYLIALLFSAVFFLLYPLFFRIIKNKYLVGIFYGTLIWLLMNIVVLPLTNTPKPHGNYHFSLPGIIFSLAALIICVGLPVALIAGRYYRKKLSH